VSPTATLWLLLAAAPSPLTPLALPGGEGGVGFDDMLYAPGLGKVLVPAGRTGRLDLVDPANPKIESVEGFSASASASGGHGEGTTSADFGRGLIFASDRSRGVVVVVDVKAGRIVSSAKLKGGPDYVRWVEPLGEVWVTEPNKKAIEYFRLTAGSPPALESSGQLTVPDGPESLVIDAARRRAYTHTWKDETLVLDLKAHKLLERWKNGCEGSRGIALDEPHGFLFVGCDEGKAVTLDVAHGFKALGSAKAGKGVDIIAFAGKLKHLYVPGGDDATLTVMDVGADGKLSVVDTFTTAADSHCVAADDAGNAYVCDPKRGGLLVLHDKAAPTSKALAK
jgi:hypothetical protein